MDWNIRLLGIFDIFKPINYGLIERRAAQVIDKFFEPVFIADQKLLSNPEKEAKILDMIPITTVREELQNRWKSSTADSGKKWRQMENALNEQKVFLYARYIFIKFSFWNSLARRCWRKSNSNVFILD
jgi:hypothetical protein